MPKTFKIPEEGAETKQSLIDQIKSEFGKYGILAFVIFIFLSWTSLIVWNVEKFIERADNQTIANEKIGILEGKMEILLQERLSSNSAICK